MRVVIVEDHALLREGMAALLQEHDIEVVAQADDGPGLLRIVEGHKPDLAVCDVRLPRSVAMPRTRSLFMVAVSDGVRLCATRMCGSVRARSGLGVLP